MDTSTLKFEIPESRLKPLVSELRESVKADCGTEYSEAAIEDSVVAWLNLKLDRLFEDAVERLSSPSWEDARDFARLLDRAETVEREERKVVPISVHPIDAFSGNRTFSLDKMAAMVSYLADRTSELYKTKLNKLLFYADFVSYYLNGNSISGSRYVHLPYGPVPDGYEETLETLGHYGVVQISKLGSADVIRADDDRAQEFLTNEDRAALDWVVETYGPMSTSEITDLSHRERAYRNTKMGEEIAYEYAKFFIKLPPKTA